LRSWIMTALVLLVLLLNGPAVSAEEPADKFGRANELYEQKEYDSAVQAYTKIINEGTESASLYFNLGNAYFKKGDLGNAILYYLRAKRLDPSDEDIVGNLEFARQFSRVQMEGVQLNPINSFLISLVDPYRIDGLAWASSGCFVLFFLFLIIRFGLGISNPGVRVGIMLSLVLLVVSTSLTTFKYRYEFLTRRGVIVAEEAPVKTGPSEQSDIELQGAPGLIVEILAETDDYYNVLFENKRRGWIEKHLVAEI
jgi:tetratricopeptide (TPR) repeat protein